MLQIDPLDPEPAFVEIASHATTIPYDLLFTSVCGDMVALVFGPIVKIWDVKTNKCVSWNTCHEPLQVRLPHLTCYIFSKYLLDPHERSICCVGSLSELYGLEDTQTF